MIDYEPVLSIITPVIAASILSFLSPILKTEKTNRIQKYIAIIGLFLPFCYLLYLYPTVSIKPIQYNMGGWLTPYAITLVIDSFNYTFLIISSLVTFLAYIFSIKDMNKAKDKFSFFFLLMVAGIYGVFLSVDLFNIYVFFELCVITSYILVTLGDQKKSLKAAFTYLILGSIASLFFLLGLGLLYFHTGALNIYHLAGLVHELDMKVQVAVFIFLFGAVAVKAALPPFHTWLVDAHSTAPSAVSAVLSGITVKIGLYIYLRVFSLGFQLQGMTELLLMVGALAALGGVIFALFECDIKRLLAYHTISQMGYIIAGFATFSTIGVAGGLYHLVNHAIFKGLLFLCAGCLIYRTGSKDIRKHNVGTTMPITLITYVIAACAIAGVTPFNGSASKLMIEYSLSSHVLIWFIFLVASIGTITTFSKIFYYSFLKPAVKQRVHRSSQEVPFSMLFPMIILAFFCVVLGLFPHLVLERIILPATSLIIPGDHALYLSFFDAAAILKEWILIAFGLLVLLVVIKRSQDIERICARIVRPNLNMKVVMMMFALTLMMLVFTMLN
jgi:multicomponent Na+:H+ antiporter subunit D